MKKVVFTWIMILALALSACAGQNPGAPAAGDGLTAKNGEAPAKDGGAAAIKPGSGAAYPAQPGDAAAPDQPGGQPDAPAGGYPAPAAGQPDAGQPAAGQPDDAALAALLAGLDSAAQDGLPAIMQLLVGILKLDGTDLAVSKDQAVELLALWNEYKTLAQGAPGQGAPQAAPDTPAAPAAQTPLPTPTVDAETQAKIEALAEEIAAVFSAEQLAAIAALDLTLESALTILQESGLLQAGPDGQSSGAAQGTPPAPPSGGQGGQPPAGGPGGQPPSGGQGGQPPAGGAPGATGASGLPPQAIDVIIRYLETLAGVTPGANAAAALASQPPAGGAGGTAVDASAAGAIAVYSLAGGSVTLSGQTYTATETDQTAVYVTGGAALTLAEAIITTSGDTSSDAASSFYGLNAAVLAANGGVIALSSSAVSTGGTGANGVFASGSGSAVTLTDVSITAAGDGGHAVMATNGAALTLTDVDMKTTGKNSGAIATDRGSGVIHVIGGSATTSGQDSPAIYSTGAIDITGATLSAGGAEAAVIEGANSITLNDCDLSSSLEKWGVMIYQSMSGDAEGQRGVFTMNGGSLAYTPENGPLFYVTNTSAVITLRGVTVTNNSGALIQAAAGRWGASGANGGQAILTADGQTLAGDLEVDDLSSIELILQNGSTLIGALNPAHSAGSAGLTLDAGSVWTVTGESYLASLALTGGLSGDTIENIIGNGYTVYYDAAGCPDLGGQVYTLAGGGYLKPISG